MVVDERAAVREQISCGTGKINDPELVAEINNPSAHLNERGLGAITKIIDDIIKGRPNGTELCSERIFEITGTPDPKTPKSPKR